jgi:hypothetical protein
VDNLDGLEGLLYRTPAEDGYRLERLTSMQTQQLGQVI